MGIFDFLTRPSPTTNQQSLSNTARSNMGTLAPRSTSTPQTSGGQVQGASTLGSTYYDSTTGQMMRFDPASGQWSPFTATGQAPQAPRNTGLGGGTGRGTGGTTPSYSQEDMGYLDNQSSLYDRLLQSLRSTEASGIQRLDQSKIEAENNAKAQQERALRDFSVKREDTTRAKQNALGQVDTNARTLSDSMRRIIGMAAGSGASANLAANSAVARQASQQRNNVMSGYAANERDLSTAENDTNVDFESLLQDIANQRRQKEEEFRAGLAQQEQGIVQSQGEIAAERARLQGGNALSAMRPFQDRFFGLQNNIDQLPSQFATNVTPRDLNVRTPQLRDYLVDRQAVNATRQSGQAQYSPYSAFLNRRDEEEKLAVR